MSDRMTHADLIRIAREAGFKVEPGKRPGVMWVVDGGGLSLPTLAKFAELIAERCADISHDGHYNCCCDSNIRRRMTVVEQ